MDFETWWKSEGKIMSGFLRFIGVFWPKSIARHAWNECAKYNNATEQPVQADAYMKEFETGTTDEGT